jgi:RNA polymerase sigma-70 factor (ECF subfamily)
VNDATFVREALDRLSASDSEILTLVAWEGMTPREIAGILRLPPSVVSVRLHRAKKRLRSLLGEPAAGGAKSRVALRTEEAP